MKNCKPGEAITVEGGDKEVTLRYPIGSQFAESKVDTLPVEDFPVIPEFDTPPVPLGDSIREAILEAMQCASTDETRYILNGCYLDLSDQRCQQIVATDGRHLYSSNSFSLPLQQSLLIPDRKFLGWREFNSDGEWQLQVQPGKDGPGMLQISSRRWSFQTRQIEGNYPNWRQVVPAPKQYNTTVVLPPPSLEAVLALIPRIPCHDQMNQTIGIQVEGGKLSLRGRGNGDTRWTELDIAGAEGKGSPVTIYVNRVFLSKALRFGLNKIEIIDPLTPLRFSSGGRQMIVMPIRADGPPPLGKQSEEPGKPAETHQSAPQGANQERNIMPTTTTNGTTNGTNRNGHHDTTKPAIEVALDKIETIKGSYRDAVRGLNDLADTLKQVQREQKSTDREVQSVRTTLEKLQTVRI